MEKEKISGYQLYVLVTLFEMGSAILFGLGAEAKQDAWIAVLLGLISGLLIFFVYHRLVLVANWGSTNLSTKKDKCMIHYGSKGRRFVIDCFDVNAIDYARIDMIKIPNRSEGFTVSL